MQKIKGPGPKSAAWHCGVNFLTYRKSEMMPFKIWGRQFNNVSIKKNIYNKIFSIKNTRNAEIFSFLFRFNSPHAGNILWTASMMLSDLPCPSLTKSFALVISVVKFSFIKFSILLHWVVIFSNSSLQDLSEPGLTACFLKVCTSVTSFSIFVLMFSNFEWFFETFVVTVVISETWFEVFVHWFFTLETSFLISEISFPIAPIWGRVGNIFPIFSSNFLTFSGKLIVCSFISYQQGSQGVISI